MNYNYFIKTTIAVCVFLFSGYSSMCQSKIELYGMTEYGGANGLGTIYKTDTAGNITILASFNGANGSQPYGGLIEASDGMLYGMTSIGGDSSDGVIFKCDTNGNITLLYSLRQTSGVLPLGNLVQANDGNLYGLTPNGGLGTYGTLFRCTLSGTVTVLANFGYTADGENPFGTLIQYTDNNLYGMTYTGAGSGSTSGTIFKCSLSGTLSDVYEFAGYNGQNPNSGGLLLASDGYMYAAVTQGGAYSDGLINKFAVGPLVSFNGLNGSEPGGNIIQASDGKFYGLTNTGGGNGYGTLFSCTTTGTITDLFDFSFATTGAVGTIAKNTLVQASDGYIYGTTTQGGTGGAGTLFKYKIGGNLRIIGQFSGNTTSGGAPFGNLVQYKKVVTGIASIKNTNSVEVYPNPGNGIFNIKIKDGEPGVINVVEVYNLLGEKIYTTRLNTVQAQIDFKNNAPGIYLYRVTDETGKLISEGKFIVQK